MNRQFTLRYLPLFEQDLSAVRDYIALNLKNPMAAIRLVDDTEKAMTCENIFCFIFEIKSTFVYPLPFSLFFPLIKYTRGLQKFQFEGVRQAEKNIARLSRNSHIFKS